MTHTESFLRAVRDTCSLIFFADIERLAQELFCLRDRKGRLFILGVGGSAPNCSHAVNDFRKLCGIEAYAPTDNVAEITARTNDDGWETVFAEWLKVSRLNENDAILILSVGGGSADFNVSANLNYAIDLAKARGARVLGIVGSSSGYTAHNGDLVVVVPTVNPAWVTPLSEAFQAVVWHCLVSHPNLQRAETKW